MRTIEFLYDFASPNAYLVHKVLPGMARKHGADVVWEPVLLGGIFKATGNQAPMHAFDGVAGKLDYQAVELQRFVHRHDLAFRMNPHFPIMTISLMRGAVFAQDKPWYARYIDCVFDAMWVDGKDMGDPAIISAALNAVDLPGEEILMATQDPSIKGRLMAATEKAVERGVFGAPTMFLGDEMFFGKDSLDDLEWRLAGIG
jgi:2-hydroxychromene-2-carboxylate isomerase